MAGGHDGGEDEEDDDDESAFVFDHVVWEDADDVEHGDDEGDFEADAEDDEEGEEEVEVAFAGQGGDLEFAADGEEEF